MSDNPRSCGACTACCTALGVTELDKPMGARCVHERAARGCAIYADRPPSCRGYRCGWLQGALPEEFRPDRAGFIIEPWRLPDGGEDGVLFREVREGALDSSACYAVTQALVQAGRVLYLMYLGENRALLGPTARVKSIADAVLRPN